ncbi:MAG: NAD-glutamate dehydrogenase [Planctomycetes bacterium]|nr:NAD-glutamate dehydrogenase [Planctomycetota bacterium]
MNLTELEYNNLAAFRSWVSWLEKELPDGFFHSLDDFSLNLLVHTLCHFDGGSEASTNVYEGGAFIISKDEQEVFSKQLEKLIQQDIRKIFMISTKSKSPGGLSKILIAHVQFAGYSEGCSQGFNSEDRKETVKKQLKTLWSEMDENSFEESRNCFDPSFLNYADEKHIAKNFVLLNRCLQDINVKAEVQKHNKQDGLICLALANRRAERTGFFLNLIRVFEHYDFRVKKVQTIYTPCDDLDNKMLTHFYISGDYKNWSTDKKTELGRLLEALSVMQWFEAENPFNRNFFYDLNFSIHHTILISAIQQFVHQMLVHVDPNLYNTNNVQNAFQAYPLISRQLVEYFSLRFRPITVGKDDAQKVREQCLKDINRLDSGIEDNDSLNRSVLNMAIHMIDHIQKTNYYVIRHSAISFRLDPAILDSVPFADREALFPELPYSIFYVKGRNFIAFNIRFRELSRGGVRTLIPKNWNQFRHQQRTVFHECYQLAYTQQKKNKDIPEGGAKSIIFLKPNFNLERDIAAEKAQLIKQSDTKDTLGELLATKRNTLVRRHLFDAQKSFCDTLLDILVWNPTKKRLVQENIRDYYGKEEWVFLGPDENMTDQMIDWISSRSESREYSVGSSFMSGKPDQGINHKSYGVTSLGVHQYLNEALSQLKGDQKEYSFKVTGGPDGDVAGNELLNLINGYGTKAKILCIQDGTGVLYDPKGISHSEIKRLFKSVLGISGYKTSLLHAEGFLVKIHERKEEKAGIEKVLKISASAGKKREVKNEWIGASEANNLYHHFLHGLQCDAFLPCGGRPRSLNSSNWQSFLLDDGTPSCRLIVEGANLYLSDEARYSLEKEGVMIIKDASSNKGGVICSSYEIMAGLVLTPEEFSKTKSKFIKEVLSILKVKALNEARMLVSAYANEEKSPIDLSDEISSKINHYSDLIREELKTLRHQKSAHKFMEKAFKAHIPTCLRRLAGSRLETLPHFYLDAIIASSLASSLIYKKGIDYSPNLIDSLNSEIQKGLFSNK